jgi:dTDP-4-amino-4,6-dideoxygalactose transaminase/acetyltransferase-like isoleucine patch superfamily enzyme
MNGVIDEGAAVGANTRVWMGAHVMKGAVVGKDCNIGEHVFVEGGAKVGDRVTIKNGVQVRAFFFLLPCQCSVSGLAVQIWDGVMLEDDVFVGPNATFCNDKFPRSKQHVVSSLTIVERGASLGANCTILPGIRIGAEAMIGAGSVVTHNVSPKTVVAGNPARHLRFLDAPSSGVTSAVGTGKSVIVSGAKLLSFPRFEDRRGILSFAQFETHLPWIPKRFFTITNVPQQEVRGYHAHKSVKQLLVCISGKVDVLVDDGKSRQTVLLDAPHHGLLLDVLVWSSQSYIEPGSVLLVLCSEKHDSEGYIHDYSEYLAIVNAPAPLKVPFLDIKAAAFEAEASVRGAFERVLSSSQFVGGPEVEAFEKEWAHYCQSSYCVGVGSGLAALHLLLRAADIGEGHEVMVPANTYIATLLAVSMTGAKCILVEPRADTRLLNPVLLERHLTPRTRAILSCDLYGTPVDYHAIQAFAKRHGIYFFSDAAQSHGAKYQGDVVGSDALCDGTCFSFYPSKNLGALGEAGAVVTASKDLSDRVRILRNYGSRVRYFNEEKGFNERLDPLQAAFLRAKLPQLDKLNARRAAIAQKYRAAFESLPWIGLACVDEGVQSSNHLFVITCEKRTKLQEHLKAHGVDTVIHYPVPPHLSSAYSDLELGLGSFPITETLANTVLSLPICPFLTEIQVDAVIEAIKLFSL